MILVNGTPSDSVPATDRGLAYGDGVFRTLVMCDGRPRYWGRHYAKLSGDCSTLGIACPGESQLEAEIAQAGRQDADCVLKIIVTRGPAQRGYAPPTAAQSTRIVMTVPLPQYPAEFVLSGIKARVCNIRLGLQPALAGVKHLNRLENVLARAEWSDPSIAEGLLFDTEGNAICGTMSNLFIVERSTLITPDLTRSGVAGVTRERLIQAAAGHGMSCQIDTIGNERLLRCDEVLLVNSIIGVWQVRELDGKAWMPGMVVRHVRKWLDGAND